MKPTEAEYNAARPGVVCLRCGGEKLPGEDFCDKCLNGLLVAGERQQDQSDRMYEE